MDKMTPVVINDIFTAEEIEVLLLDIERESSNADNFKIQESLGRSFCNLDSLSKALVSKIHKIAEEKTGKNLRMTGRAYSRYSSEYGKPALSPHIDINATKYILDYQVSANINWPISVEQSTYELQDNAGLIFSGKQSVHWRPKRTFNKGDYVSMIFFHFVDTDDLETSKKILEEKQESVFSRVRTEYAFYYESEAE